MLENLEKIIILRLSGAPKREPSVVKRINGQNFETLEKGGVSV
jgi:hypothetical protein